MPLTCLEPIRQATLRLLVRCMNHLTTTPLHHARLNKSVEHKHLIFVNIIVQIREFSAIYKNCHHMASTSEQSGAQFVNRFYCEIQKLWILGYPQIVFIWRCVFIISVTTSVDKKAPLETVHRLRNN